MKGKRAPRKKPVVSLLLGVGLDGDGEKRITKGRDFLLVGGSEDTHERMTECAIKLDEALAKRGRRLRDVRTLTELRDLVERAQG